ncbi:MAG TPA: type II secretion system protein GspL [Burkholderiaceae bacterium]|nr:type II secretion system protein GspL [Burkholderiaceae bacterium]
MSILVVQIPSRPRQPSAAAAETGAIRASSEYSYVMSPDGLAIGAHGSCAPALLPHADSVVAVLADADVAWHRITLPKAPSARLRAALVGVLEDALLDEADATHLALAPGAATGQPVWVAATHKPWLLAELTTLEKAGVEVERVVPSSWPDDPPSGHFTETPDRDAADTSRIRLTWSHADGVACLNLQGTMARALIARAQEQPVRWTATPAVAAPAERWLGAPVIVMPPEQRALLAARSLWNLRQFDLAPSHRGARALRDAWLRFLSPAWRPVRWGLIGLAALNILGLNLWALHQHKAIEGKQQAMIDVLRTTFPKVPTPGYETALQMQRQTDLLRTAAGRAGDDDLESLLQAAATAWPQDRSPVEALTFEPGRLTLAATGWNVDQIEQFRSQLRPAGWVVESEGGRLTVRRAARGGAS